MDEKPPPYSPPQGPYPPYGSNYPPTSTPSQPPFYQPSPPPPPPPPPPQPQPGFHAVPEAALPSYGSTVYIQQQPAPTTQVIFVGGCPACRVGVLEDDFTCLGVLFAILFFPIGILCCLALRQRRCPNCGAIFG